MNGVENNGKGSTVSTADQGNGLSKQDVSPKALSLAPMRLVSGLRKVLEADPRLPELDHEYIRLAVVSGVSEDDAVAQHSKIFDSSSLQTIRERTLPELRETFNGVIGRLQGRLQELSKELDDLNSRLHDEGEPRPWTMPDRILVVCLLVLGAMFIAVECHNGMVFARESGRNYLKQWLAGLLFSIVPAMGFGVSLKLLSLCFSSSKSRLKFLGSFCVVGLLTGVLAHRIFSFTYSGFIADPLAMITNPGQSVASSSSIIWVQLAVCGLLSANCFMVAWHIAELHDPEKRARIRVLKRAMKEKQREMRLTTKTLLQNQELRGFVEGVLNAHDAQRSRYLGDLRLAFRTEQKAHGFRLRLTGQTERQLNGFFNGRTKEL